MIDFFQAPATWLTMASVVIALIALYQTHHQIKLSNKQQLFDRRLGAYLLIEELLNCYREEQEIIQRVRLSNMQTDEMLCIQFISFTSTHSLGDISNCIYTKSDEANGLFLSKLDMLDRLWIEVVFLFPKKEATIIQEFIHTYTGLLITLYAYRNDVTLVPLPSDNNDRHLTILGLYYALQEHYEEITRNKVEAKISKLIYL